ncbi:peptide deformylase [Dietzia sp.]|uniref:peptide deformylase n=1 Tax=Dietzia sp. TaxID=1871616 RepID=UPI002FD8F9F0
MSIRPIVIAGEPVLHAPIPPTEKSAADLRGLIDDMYETLEASHGVGLAANQIGVAERVFVYDCPDIDTEDGKVLTKAELEARGFTNRKGAVINPVLETSEIPETMPDPDDDYEGCLSVPGENFPTGRAWWTRVTGLDENGEPVSVEGYGFFARCLQHEVGHLDGFLYTDVLVGRHKKAAKRAIRDNGWGVPGLSWNPETDPDPFESD